MQTIGASIYKPSCLAGYTSGVAKGCLPARPRALERPRTPPSAPQQRGPAAAAGAGAGAGAGAAPPAELQWNDVVEYRLPKPVGAATRGVGRVDEVAGGQVVVAPLEEEEEDVWVESHDAAATVLPQAAVLRVLACDYSQRQDRESNPHGEHAHDVYTLLDPPSGDVYRGPRTLKVVISGSAGSTAAE